MASDEWSTDACGWINRCGIRTMAAGLALYMVMLMPSMLGAEERTVREIPSRPLHSFVFDDSGKLPKSPVFFVIEGIRAGLAAEGLAAVCLLIVEGEGSADDSWTSIRKLGERVFDAWKLPDEGLLIAADRKWMTAHIVLGPGFDGEHRETADHIVQSLALPAFRDGHFMEGILHAVEGVDAMVRGLPMPVRMQWWENPSVWMWGAVFLLVGFIANLLFRYSGSIIWLFIPYAGAVFWLVRRSIFQKRYIPLGDFGASGGDISGLDISGGDGDGGD